MQGTDNENKLEQHTETKLTENKLAHLCGSCESQPATIQCYTCLMYLCGSVDCHNFVYDPLQDQKIHQYIGDFRDKPVYVNTSVFRFVYPPFDKWVLEKGSRYAMSLMNIDRLKQQSTLLLATSVKFIPELANLVNEYVAIQVTVGLWCDCLDCAQAWYAGEIVQIQGEIVLIRFDGWGEAFNEWIHLKSKRLAPLHTHTKLR